MTRHKTLTSARRACRDAWDEAEGAWRIETVRILDATLASLPVGPLRAVAAIHMPDEEQVEVSAETPHRCPVCQSNGCCNPDPFPCATLAALLPDGIDLPAFPKAPPLSDFWDDPELEVILNHPTTHPKYADAPRGVPIRVRHSDAMKMRGALRPVSRAAVDALS